MRFFIILLFINSLTFSQGSGKTIDFNGTNRAIDIGNQVANNCRTIEMWFKPDVKIDSTLATVVTLISRDFNNGSGLSTNEFTLFFWPGTWGGSGRGKLQFLRMDGTTRQFLFSNNNSWEANHWYHVAATIDSVSGMKMYINGILQQDTNASTNAIGVQTGSTTDNTSIAKWGNFNMRYFDGNIDEVRLWRTSRTQFQIRNKMCSKLKGNETGLKAYYRFDGNSTQLKDNSTNSYHGTLLNITNANREYSGAPIGDTSTYIYSSTNLSDSSLQLFTQTGDVFSTDSIRSTSKGIHIYKVDTIPNTLSGLNKSLTNNYYGVFLTNRQGVFDAKYNYLAYNCIPQDSIFTRNDNAILNWNKLNVGNSSCLFKLPNQSTIGYSYRAEYIIKSNIPIAKFIADTVCLGDSTMFIDSSLNTHINSTYNWTFGDGNTSLLKNPKHLYSTSGVFQVRLIVSNSTSCCKDTIIKNIIVLPQISVFLGNDTTVCNPPIVLDAQNTGSTYLWNTSSTSKTINVTNSGTYLVKVSNGLCASYDTINITIPVINLNLGNDTILCKNQTLILNAGNIGANYLWSNGATNQHLTINSSGTFWVTVSKNGCSKSDTINVSYQHPIAIFSGINLIGCSPLTSSFTDLSSTNIGSITNWNWTFGDGTFSNSQNPTHIYSIPGKYNVTLSVTTNNNCMDDSTINSLVTVHPRAIADYDFLPKIGLSGELVLFNNKSINSTSWEWKFGDGNSSILFNPKHTYLLSNTYNVELIAKTIFNCNDTIIKQIKIIDEPIIFAPNSFSPNNDGLNDTWLIIGAENTKSFNVKIFNRWGELIFETNDPLKGWDGKYKKIISQLGVYTWKAIISFEDNRIEEYFGHINMIR